MIGNDVVDIELALKESNWKRQGFLKKIFTDSEQSCILNSDHPDLTVWLLWSMKESGYKVYIQQYRQSFFAPLRFECRLLNVSHSNYEGEVTFGDAMYKTTSEHLDGSIFTIAFADKYPAENHVVYDKIKFSMNNYLTQHKEIYHSILNRTSELMGNPADQLVIKKDLYGIPEIYNGEEKVNFSFSLSHHGRYGAYVLFRESPAVI